MGERPENRVDRIVSGLLHGRRLRLRGGDAEEKEAVVMAAGLVVRPTNGRWVDVGALADFTPGQARIVKAGAVGAFVTRDGDSVSAVSSICSDLPCELWWDSSQHTLVCPCHNRTFTAQGSSIGTYRLPSLDVVQVRVRDGRVEVLGV